jgi:hypothetical protein
MQPVLQSKIRDVKDICQQLKVKRLYAFGSVVSGNFKDDSDIDFLLSFADGLSIQEYTGNYFRLHYKLREIFNREIDLITERTLSNPYFIDSINESKELLYES